MVGALRARSSRKQPEPDKQSKLVGIFWSHVVAEAVHQDAAGRFLAELRDAGKRHLVTGAIIFHWHRKKIVTCPGRAPPFCGILADPSPEPETHLY